jgi:hypothetical protein
MPKHWLTEVESLSLTSFPKGAPEAGVITFFTLTESDSGLLIRLHGEAYRLEQLTIA